MGGILPTMAFRGKFCPTGVPFFGFRDILRILHGCTEIRNFSSHVEKYFTCFQHKKRNFVYPRGHVMFYFLYNTHECQNISLNIFCCKRHDLLCSHSIGDLFTCENNMLFSCFKISCFRSKAHVGQLLSF